MWNLHFHEKNLLMVKRSARKKNLVLKCVERGYKLGHAWNILSLQCCAFGRYNVHHNIKKLRPRNMKQKGLNWTAFFAAFMIGFVKIKTARVVALLWEWNWYPHWPTIDRPAPSPHLQIWIYIWNFEENICLMHLYIICLYGHSLVI